MTDTSASVRPARRVFTWRRWELWALSAGALVLSVAPRSDAHCFLWAKAGNIRRKATLTATVEPTQPTQVVVRLDANNG